MPALRAVAFLLGCVIGPACFAQTLHAVIVADTTPPELTTGASASMGVIRALGRDVARYTDLTYKWVGIEGESVSAAKISAAVAGLNVGSDDVVLFYYVGHGERSTHGDLPLLWVGIDRDAGLDANEIRSAIRAKAPRLAIIVIEACNRAPASFIQGPSGAIPLLAPAQDNYRTLFRQARGEFVAMAAQPGEAALLDRATGGIFTSAFVGALKDMKNWQDGATRLNEPLKVSKGSGVSEAVNQQPRVEWHEGKPPQADKWQEALLRPPQLSPQLLPRRLPTPVMISVGDNIYAARDLVTVGQFRAFVEATGRSVEGPCKVEHLNWKPSNEFNWKSPGYAQTDNHPVVCVSHEDAIAYVDWLSSYTHSRYRLMPLDWWQVFANRAEPLDNAVCRGCRVSTTSVAAVGSASPDKRGLNDILGNVWQWLDDCGGSKCQVRGGAWVDQPDDLRSRAIALGNSDRTNATGFRVVRTGD
jgi:hypothetical protein